jgi:peptide-methionine (S)-S-oxide reductase
VIYVKLDRIGLGGGCYWCTEAVFQNIRGVSQVAQGFIRSESPDNSYSEAVIVEFSADEIQLSDLIEVHLLTHASTSQHTMRKKYRSAVYFFSPQQEEIVSQILQRLQINFDQTLITRVLAFSGFRHSEKKYQGYYRKNRGNPFCQRYIDPKLDQLRHNYARLMRPD